MTSCWQEGDADTVTLAAGQWLVWNYQVSDSASTVTRQLHGSYTELHCTYTAVTTVCCVASEQTGEALRVSAT